MIGFSIGVGTVRDRPHAPCRTQPRRDGRCLAKQIYPSAEAVKLAAFDAMMALKERRE